MQTCLEKVCAHGGLLRDKKLDKPQPKAKSGAAADGEKEEQKVEFDLSTGWMKDDMICLRSLGDTISFHVAEFIILAFLKFNTFLCVLSKALFMLLIENDQPFTHLPSGVR